MSDFVSVWFNTIGFADPEEDKRAKEILEEKRAELKEKFTGRNNKSMRRENEYEKKLLLILLEDFNSAFLENEDDMQGTFFSDLSQQLRFLIYFI